MRVCKATIIDAYGVFIGAMVMRDVPKIDAGIMLVL